MDISTSLYGIKHKLIDGKVGCSFECRSLLLGALVKFMHDYDVSGYGTLEAAPQTRSIEATIRLVREMKSPSRDWHPRVPTQTSLGLFGSATPRPASPSPAPVGSSSSSSGGFHFGSSGSTPTPSSSGGGLFGSSGPAPTSSSSGGGLFGSSRPTPTPSSSAGGLFGSAGPPSSSSGGGLFGSTGPSSAGPTSSSSAGGLFGAAPSKSTSSGGVVSVSTGSSLTTSCTLSLSTLTEPCLQQALKRVMGLGLSGWDGKEEISGTRKA